MKWHTQAVIMTTNLKVAIYFTLPALIMKIFVTCKCNVDESAKGRHDMILGRYVLI